MSRLLIGIMVLWIPTVTVWGSNPEYVQSIRAWQKHRAAGLRTPDSWLTLAGLFWLKPGNNTIGSAESNDFVLPKGSAPDRVGTLRLEGKNVLFANSARAAVTVDNKPVSGEIRLKYNENDQGDVVRAGSISFYVIERNGKLGIRAKDSESPVLKNFTGLTYFPINAQYRFEARFVPEPKKIPILDIIGQTGMQDSPGYVEFTFQGRQYKLRPLIENDTLFFLFKDPTNRAQTYPAGRMLNTPMPANGKVDLDFNKSYNPPCTFTPYATCPLPPKENTLDFPVIAGELRYGKGRPE